MRLAALSLALFCGLLLAAPQRAFGVKNPLQTTRSRVQFEGASSFSEAELNAPIAEEVRGFTESGLTPARADDTAFYLASFYRKNGFARVEVGYKIRGDTLVLQVQEGPRTLLREVKFSGNKSIPSATLFDYMVGGTEERLVKEATAFPYNESEIMAGADRVRGLYISEGFLDVAVDATQIGFSENGTRAGVTVRIEEHQFYSFGDVEFSGEAIFPREELVNTMGEPIGGGFSKSKLTNAQRNLESHYKARGYYEAAVEVAADPKAAVGGRVPVRFTMKPGPLYHFDGITVAGLDRLRPSFLPKRFAHLSGEVYDPAKLDETYREMLRTGLFKNLRVSPAPIEGNQLRLDLTVEESKAKEVGAAIGAGSYEGGIVTLRLADRDLFGRGRPLTLTIDYSQRGLRAELLYVDPWLFDSRFALRSSLYSAQRTEEGYSKNATGARFDLSRKLLPHLEIGTFLQAETTTTTSDGIPEELLGPLDYFFASIGLTSTVDYRNDPTNPERGFIFTNSIDLSTVDGELAFSRISGRFSYYLPLGKTLLAFGARAGLITPVDKSTQIPIDLRYFNGGGTTVRSFAERELGPTDPSGQYPIGGNFFTVFNTEYTFPIFGGVLGAVFVDAGNVAGNASLGDVRYAVGAGLRYKLPIGPLRLDYGVNPAPRADESFGAFHFSFGFAF